MPKTDALKRARQDEREGKSPSTQAGEFVREEIREIRQHKHGARSTAQAIAIGLSEARCAGVALPPSKGARASEETRRSAQRDLEVGREPGHKPSAKRSAASRNALKREGSAAASEPALSRQAKTAAARRTPQERSASAREAAQTKSPAERSAAAQKAARTRARHAAGRVK
jgi:hypothetical protein